MEDNKKAEEIEDIIGRPPASLTQWGTSLIVIITLALIYMGWTFKIPEKVSADINITTVDPTIPVYTLHSGSLKEIFLEDRDSVKKGALIAILDTDGDYEDILTLESILEKIEQFDEDYLEELEVPSNLNLGNDLQARYFRFLNTISDIDFEEGKKSYDKRVLRRLKRKKDPLERKISNYKKQLVLLEEERRLKKNELNFGEKRLRAGANIDLEVLTKTKESYSAKTREINRLKESLVEAQEELAELNIDIFTTENGYGQREKQKYNDLKREIQQLLLGLEDWKIKFLIHSPSSGILYYKKSLDKGDRTYVKKDNAYFEILPLGAEKKIYGVSSMELDTYSKVKEGDVVFVKVLGFPEQEYGVLDGVVKFKSPINEEDYQIEINLPNYPITSNGSQIPFALDMRATGQVITAKKRLWERVLGGINIKKRRS